MTALKTLVAVLAAVLAAILPGFTGNSFGLVELINVVVLAANAIQVFNAANLPGYRWAKLIAAAAAAAGVIAISALSDGRIDASEWVQIAIAIAGAVGVGGVPNVGTTGGVFLTGRHALAS